LLFEPEVIETSGHQAQQGVRFMLQIAEAVVSCALFLIAGIAGLIVRRYLPERHRDRDTMDFVRLAVGALVTFLAIVLGLLTASSKSHFDDVANSYHHLAAKMVLLDDSLRAIGREAEPIRGELRAYLAAVIFSTWPDEPAPSGDFPRGLTPGQAESTELTVLLRHVGEQVQELHATTPIEAKLIAALPQQFDAFSNARWAVIETEGSTIPTAFYNLMLFWTALMFVGFGLCAPHNAVVAVTVLICAISLASVIFVILELDDTTGGVIAISSSPLRDALVDIDRATTTNLSGGGSIDVGPVTRATAP
jgi:hypothetical protein